MQVSGCKIEKSELLRYLGHSGQDIDDRLQSRIDELSERCMRVSKPVCAYGVFPISETENGVSVSDGAAYLSGKDISAHLHGAQSCAFMAVTLGMESEREMRALESVSVTDALIFSAACTALTESAADICEEMIRKEASESGRFLNFRYSPGYGDFPLEAQKKLLKLIDAEKSLGITLTDGLMMVPRKSVSAVIGIFEAMPEKRRGGCDLCSAGETCPLRKRGESCGK